MLIGMSAAIAGPAIAANATLREKNFFITPPCFDPEFKVPSTQTESCDNSATEDQNALAGYVHPSIADTGTAYVAAGIRDSHQTGPRHRLIFAFLDRPIKLADGPEISGNT